MPTAGFAIYLRADALGVGQLRPYIRSITMQAFTALLQTLMAIFGGINKAAKGVEVVADQTLAGLVKSRNAAYKDLAEFQASDEGISEAEVNRMIKEIMEG